MKKPAKESGTNVAASTHTRKASDAHSRIPKRSHTQPVQAAIYARTAAEPDGDDDSRIRQVDACKRAVAEEGWIIANDHIGIDSGISGNSNPASRLALSELLSAASTTAKPFDVVICDDASRLSRNLQDGLEVIRRFKQHGVEVRFADPLAEEARRHGAKSAMFDKLTRRRKGTRKATLKPKLAR